MDPAQPSPEYGLLSMFATDITVTLGHNDILHAVDFSAQAGQVTAIVGPNGSGKSTLLRALTGEVEYGGQVVLNGTNIKSLKGWELAAIRGVLPQSTTIAFPFTAIEIVRLGLTTGLSAAQSDIPIQALQKVDLPHFADWFYHELSGGEQQRVQLARVLAQIWQPVSDGAPRWLILDEPVASLDIGHQLIVMNLSREFARAGGGVITVMHDLNLTAMFADRVTLMTSGKIAAEGAPKDVFVDTILSNAYGCALRVNTAPSAGVPFLLPQSCALG
jgi:heme transport system ATP-binding protein